LPKAKRHVFGVKTPLPPDKVQKIIWNLISDYTATSNTFLYNHISFIFKDFLNRKRKTRAATRGGGSTYTRNAFAAQEMERK